MSTRYKQTFIQRRHTDGRWVHEKMLNITNYQRNVNQNYNEVSPGEDIEKGEPCYTVGKHITWYNHYGKHPGASSKKLKIELLYDLAITRHIFGENYNFLCLQKADILIAERKERRKKVKALSHVRLFATPWTVAHQAPPFMGFSRQEYWSGWPFPSPGDLPDPGIEPKSPALQADALTSEPPGKLRLTETSGPQKFCSSSYRTAGKETAC